MGGSPTRSVNRRGERGARHTGLGRERCDGPGVRRVVLQHAQRGTDDRIAGGVVPRGRLRLRTREPRPQDRDQEQVEQAVEHDLLAGLVLRDLGRQQGNERRVSDVAAVHDQTRERAQQPLTDLARVEVRADEHHHRAIGVVAPGAHTEVHRLGEILTVGRRAALARMDHDLRRRARVVGEEVRLRPAGDDDVAGTEPGAVTVVEHHPRLAVNHRHQRERRFVLHPDRPRRVHDRAQHEGAPRPRSVQQADECVHRNIVDAWT